MKERKSYAQELTDRNRKAAKRQSKEGATLESITADLVVLKQMLAVLVDGLAGDQEDDPSEYLDGSAIDIKELLDDAPL